MTPIPERSGGVSDHDTGQENDWAVIDRDTQRWRVGVDQKTAETLAELLVDHDRRVEIINPDGSRELRGPEPGGGE